MAYHTISVVVPKDDVDLAIEAAKRDGATLAGVSSVKGGSRSVSFIVSPDCRQVVLDDLQKALHKVEDWQITISPIEAIIAKKSKELKDNENTQSREELMADISKGAKLSPNFLFLVVTSAVVAALGMIEDNVAVIIGAMVIAPLLGPVLASILGVSLGERSLIIESIKTSAAGVALAISLGIVLGLIIPFDIQTAELASRGSAGFEDIAMALAAGIAAALSVTSGVSSVLVGVMVAVALLPPATAIGLFIGKQELGMAGGAAMLLAINLCALYLSGQIVFFLRGIKPRTWYMRKKAEQSIRFSIGAWAILLLILSGLIGYKFLQ